MHFNTAIFIRYFDADCALNVSAERIRPNVNAMLTSCWIRSKLDGEEKKRERGRELKREREGVETILIYPGLSTRLLSIGSTPVFPRFYSNKNLQIFIAHSPL